MYDISRYDLNTNFVGVMTFIPYAIVNGVSQVDPRKLFHPPTFCLSQPFLWHIE